MSFHDHKSLLSLPLCFLAFVSFVTVANAQTTITEDMANGYYERCIAGQSPIMSEESQKSMCACTSAYMMENLVVEDIQAMAGQDQQARVALNKMITEVYAPCMSDPVQDLFWTRCMEDDKIDSFGLSVTQEELCSCVATQTGEWYEGMGRELMKKALMLNPNLEDLAEPMMRSTAFQKASYEILMQCVQSY